MTTRRCCRGRYGCLIAVAILMVACGKKDDDEDGIGPGPGGPPRALSIRIDGPSRVTQLDQVSFKVLQTWSDGSSSDVTAAATLSSSNSSVLSISAGLGMAVAAGEVGLTAQFEGFTSQRKTVFVIPTTPEWNGAYRLTVGGGACGSSMPPELRQRTFGANVGQHELTLTVKVSTFGVVAGRIFNPEAVFYLANTSRAINRGRMRPVAARQDEGRVGPSLSQSGYRRSVYWPSPDTGIVELLPDGNRLVIVGEAVTTMSPSGFTGTLNGALTLYERNTRNQLAVCSSPSHAFVLARS
jgi:hypothetical protein